MNKTELKKHTKQFPQIDKLITNLFQEEAGEFYIWLSKVQNNNSKDFLFQKVIFLIAPRASGKTSLIKLLKDLFNYDMEIINQNDLTKEYPKFLTKKLIAIDEFNFYNQKMKDHFEKIKFLQTARYVGIERNGGLQELPVKGYSFLITTNMPFENLTNSRRNWIVKAPKVKHQDHADVKLFKYEMQAFHTFLNLIVKS
jgi:hypothetical protein